MCSFLFFFSFLETIFVLAMCHVSIAFYKQASRLFSIVIIGVNQTTGFFTSFLFIPLFYFFFRFIQMEHHSWSAAVAEGLESLFGQNRSKVVSVWYEWKNEWMKRTVEKNGHVWANYVADKHVRSRVCVSKSVLFFAQSLLYTGDGVKVYWNKRRKRKEGVCRTFKNCQQ